jgi:hypothetical protein
VPLRAKVVAAVETLPRRQGILFPASEGGRINIDNWRSREWVPALTAAGLDHRRSDLRHAPHVRDVEPRGRDEHLYARAADGHERPVIDATYGHLAHDADEHDRELLDACDAATGHVVGTESAAEDDRGEAAP